MYLVYWLWFMLVVQLEVLCADSCLFGTRVGLA
jgi:hypothetical protein